LFLADKSTIHIDLTDNSGMVLEEFQAACLRALERCGMKAESYAVDLCPVDTGNLQNSITHLLAPDEQAVYIGVPQGPTSYGIYVELGTGKYYPGGRPTPWVYQDAKGNWHMTHGQRAQPYLKPAVADHAQTYKNIIEDELKNG